MPVALYMDVHVPRAVTNGFVGALWMCSQRKKTMPPP
jgi:hypothetical protein